MNDESLPQGAIEAGEWQEYGFRDLIGTLHGPFRLYAYEDVSGAIPIRWEAILAEREEPEAFDAALLRQLAEHASAAADELDTLNGEGRRDDPAG
ncbi:hypothetical protein [Mycobacterium terramassiliense]|uniref:Mycobacterium terramassiliense ORFan n=1 Tax=Mycobacterium terramassiliense TaxID=1841859 RepID=A0A2U3NKI0_9MYCO|nr:hypothetical protein [Mycobacterium terramassiliense]SPM32047.1 Mycobacterium terramassiliense ORFan [Mycobacterium terramassiliense]